jgi:hypothetical protein
MLNSPCAWSILSELFFIVRLILLLISAVAAEHNFILNHTRVSLKVRQCAALTKCPLCDVVDVSFHQCQILPAKTKATGLSPNVALSSWMPNLASRAFTSRKRFSRKEKLYKLAIASQQQHLTFRSVSVDDGSNKTSIG